MESQIPNNIKQFFDILTKGSVEDAANYIGNGVNIEDYTIEHLPDVTYAINPELVEAYAKDGLVGIADYISDEYNDEIDTAVEKATDDFLTDLIAAAKKKYVYPITIEDIKSDFGPEKSGDDSFIYVLQSAIIDDIMDKLILSIGDDLYNNYKGLH